MSKIKIACHGILSGIAAVTLSTSVPTGLAMVAVVSDATVSPAYGQTSSTSTSQNLNTCKLSCVVTNYVWQCQGTAYILGNSYFISGSSPYRLTSPYLGSGMSAVVRCSVTVTNGDRTSTYTADTIVRGTK